MRFVIPVVLALCAMLAVGAQEQVLRLSESATVVKITDPERQLTTFAPLVTYLEGFLANLPQEAQGQIGGIRELREQIVLLANTPGIDAKGDFWLVSMPATPEAMAAVEEAMKPDKNGKVDPERMRAAMRQASPTYFIVPLADAAAFTAHRQALRGKPLEQALSGAVIGRHVVTLVGDPAPPPFTALAFDIEFLTKHDIAISSQLAQANNPMGGMGMGMPFLAPLGMILEEMKANVQRTEVGVTMVGQDLSLEIFTVPVADSLLAQSLAAPAPTRLAVEYAGYLPENLAYCAAGDAALPGLPGAGKLVTQVVTGLLAFALPPQRVQSLGDSIQALSVQWSQGRAIGVTAPSANGQDTPTLIAIYHMADPTEMALALQNVVSEVQQTIGDLGMMGEMLKITVKPAVEKVGGVSIDLVNMTFKTPPMPAGAGPAMPPISFDFRLAFMEDKLLITAGAQGGKEMANLVTRIQQNKGGFANSARFKALRKTMPDTARGFDSLSTLDAARAVVTMIPLPDVKANGLRVLSVFPPQLSSITMYQEVREGHLRGEFTVPNEQMQFLFTVVNGLMAMGGAQPATPARK